MRYVIAIFLPPVAVLMSGNFASFLLNCVLSIVWLPGMIHAILVVNKYEASKQRNQLLATVMAGRPVHA